MKSPLETRSILPLELTSFIGRERETAELCHLVSTTRLLTLTGAGGSGKTRLALQVVRALTADTQREFAWVELAALNDPAHIAPHIARACGINEEIRGDAALLAGLLQ